MCGLIGITNNKNAVAKDIIYGLKALEYRGYDSAGIIFNQNFEIFKTTKSIEMLNQMIDEKQHITGIGHTRWATHGAICTANTHPIQIGNAAIVHNGIVENHTQLAQETKHKKTSETDTETLLAYLLHLLNNNFEESNILKALAILLKKAEGSYAAAIVFKTDELQNKIFWIKKGVSPLIIAKTNDGHAIASDECAINISAGKATIYELPTESVGLISPNEFKIEGTTEEVKHHTLQKHEHTHKSIDKSWLETEIEQQVNIYKHAQKEFDAHKHELAALNLKQYDFITLIGCGSAYFAAQIGALWFEEEGMRAKAEIASEWNCRKSAESKNTLVILISQSGETADTILALNKAKEMGLKTIAIVNKERSTIAKESDMQIFLRIGQEQSVASTKAFTTQLIKLFQLTKHKSLPDNLAQLAEYAMNLDISHIAKELADKNLTDKLMMIGKNTLNFIAQEGALKMKELTYTHIEAHASGELKHGYIALVDEKTYAIGLAAAHADFQPKTLSNLEEIRTRAGKLILIAPHNTIDAEYFIQMPEMDYEIAPLIYIIVLQRLAMEITKLKQLSLDRPRNLAKAITVV